MKGATVKLRMKCTMAVMKLLVATRLHTKLLLMELKPQHQKLPMLQKKPQQQRVLKPHIKKVINSCQCVRKILFS
jgi:hypothetical protein